MIPLLDRIETALDRHPLGLESLPGGDIALVYQVNFFDGEQLICKVTRPKMPSTTRIEARMLGYLKNHSDLPVPDVIYVDDHMVIMTPLETGDGLSHTAQEDAARHIAALHSIKAEQYGLGFETVIGTLPQPNDQMDNWVEFFRDKRLMHMARVSRDIGRIDDAFYARIKKFSKTLPDLIGEPKSPSLLHGDLWTGNVLVKGDKISGFIDPAIYYGHAEMDLAFSTLFGTFGQRFFDAYKEYRTIEPGFYEERRDIYNLWPLLVHVRLFGGSYVKTVSNILTRFGY